MPYHTQHTYIHTSSELKSLRLLRVDRNQLRVLPASLTRLTRLADLFLKSNALTELPAGFSALSSLGTCKSHANETRCPLTFAISIQLERLYVCRNRLIAPPPRMCCLRRLTNVSFAENQLRCFPNQDVQCSELRFTAFWLFSLKVIVVCVFSLFYFEKGGKHSHDEPCYALPPNIKRLGLSGNQLRTMFEPTGTHTYMHTYIHTYTIEFLVALICF